MRPPASCAQLTVAGCLSRSAQHAPLVAAAALALVHSRRSVAPAAVAGQALRVLQRCQAPPGINRRPLELQVVLCYSCCPSEQMVAAAGP